MHLQQICVRVISIVLPLGILVENVLLVIRIRRERITLLVLMWEIFGPRTICISSTSNRKDSEKRLHADN